VSKSSASKPAVVFMRCSYRCAGIVEGALDPRVCACLRGMHPGLKAVFDEFCIQ